MIGEILGYGPPGWLASLLWLRSTAVLILAAAGVIALRRASAAARHAVWTFAVVALLALPVVAQLLPRWELAVLPAPPTFSARPAPTSPAPEPMVLLAPAFDEATSEVPPRVPLPAPREAAQRRPASAWLLLIWSAGVSAGLMQLLVGAWLVRRVARRATRITDPSWLALFAETAARLRLRRPVRLLNSALVAVPVVWGYRRSAVMLPPEAEEWPPDRKRAFLLHELAHVQRHDCLTRTLSNVARVLYWPNPLVWSAVKRLRREAERACDDRVLTTSGTSGPDYAHHLLEAARVLDEAPRPLAVLAVAERSSLEDRLLAVLDPGLRRGALTPRALAFGAVISLLLVGSAATLQPVARAVIAQATAPSKPPASSSPSASPAPSPTPRSTPASGVALAGTVKGPDGRPVPKALVMAWPEPLKRSQAPDAARTDATGAFRMGLQVTARTYRLRVEAPGLAPHTAEGVQPGAALAIGLQKGGTIEGVVQDGRSRQPVAKARVEAREPNLLSLPTAEPEAGSVLATTDAKGRYRLEGLGPGVHELQAAAAGYAQGTRRAARGATGVDFFLSPGASISGIVTGPDRRPVAGARIMPVSELPAYSSSLSTTTDQGGRFTIVGLDSGSYRLLVTAKHFAPALLQGISLDATSEHRADVRLEAGVCLRGRLVDTERKPVRGNVRLQELSGVEMSGPMGSAAVRTEVTAEGRFELEPVPSGTLALGIRPQGFPQKRLEVDVSGKETIVDLGDIEMEAGLSVRGRVRARDGSPIAGASVSASVLNEALVFVETAADGTFLLSGLASGGQQVRAEAAGFVAASRSVEPGGPPLELVLEKAGEVTGVVVDKSGRAVAGYAVSAAPNTPVPGQISRSTPQTPVGADGRFRIGSLMSGAYLLRVDADGYAMKTVSNVSVEAGRTTDAGRIVLDAGGYVQGVVTDRQGQPVAGAEVWASDPLRMGAMLSSDRRTAPTDGSGRFEMRGLPFGTVALKAAHRQYAASEAVEVTVEPETGPAVARFVLSEGGRVAGIVRRREAPGSDQLYAQLMPREFSQLHQSPRGRIGEDGSFALEHVPPGRAVLMLVAGRLGRYDGVFSKEIEVRDGETVSVEIMLADVKVEGRVSRGGQPVAQARISLRDEVGGLQIRTGPPAVSASGPQRMTALTREDGSYELIVPVPGRYRVDLSAPSRSLTLPSEAREVQVPDAPAFRLDLDLPDSSLSGAVIGEDTQKPLVRASIMAASPDGEVYRDRTGDDGRFDLTLSPASYKLRVEADDYVTDESTVDIAAGKSAARTFRLTRGGTLKVRVVDSRGRAVASPMTVATSADGRVVRGRRGTPDGTADIGGLTPGDYTVLAASETAGFALQSGVTAGGPPATLSLTAGVSLRLQFKDENGTPLARVPVVYELLRLDGTAVGLERIVSYAQRLTTDDAGFIEAALPLGQVALTAYTRDRKRTGALALDTRAGVAEVVVTVRAAPTAPRD